MANTASTFNPNIQDGESQDDYLHRLLSSGQYASTQDAVNQFNQSVYGNAVDNPSANGYGHSPAVYKNGTEIGTPDAVWEQAPDGSWSSYARSTGGGAQKPQLNLPAIGALFGSQPIAAPIVGTEPVGTPIAMPTTGIAGNTGNATNIMYPGGSPNFNERGPALLPGTTGNVINTPQQSLNVNNMQNDALSAALAKKFAY